MRRFTSPLTAMPPTSVLPPQVLSEQGAVLRTLQQRFPQALAFYVFGSQANGQANAQSDVDLAVLLPGYADAQTLWDTAMELAALLNRHVDLLDLRAASTVMQHQVLTTGNRLWGDDLPAGLFECFVLTEKLHLDEARAGLLRDIAQRGRIHG
jgi:predicted nucleotidyltransferase